MTLGMQDYQKIIRPRYGAARAVGFGDDAVAGGTITLFAVTGRGMIYGGNLASVGLASQKEDAVTIKIDGVQIQSVSFSTLNFYGYDSENSSPFYIKLYDDANFRYSVALSRGCTFESSFSVYYTETQDNTPFVTAGVVYALI